jgi:hypothetical protein
VVLRSIFLSGLLPFACISEEERLLLDVWHQAGRYNKNAVAGILDRGFE